MESDKPILISAHNPVTGARHLGHYFGAMKSLVECQYDYDTIVVIDDLLAYFMYPKVRPQIQNRTFYVIQDFINAGFDVTRNSIVVTSQIASAFLEHLLYYSSVVDADYCNHLHENSFLGSLKSYQRKELGLGNYPSVIEWLYPQIGISALTLGLGAKFFQGGEEIIGYIYIMDEIAENYEKKYGVSLASPKYIPSKIGYITGTDGKYMVQANCLYLSESEKTLREKVHSIEDKNVLVEWYNSMHMEHKAAHLKSSVMEVDDKIDMSETLLEELRPFRDNKMTNREIIEVINEGSRKAVALLGKTAASLRDHFWIPNL